MTETVKAAEHADYQGAKYGMWFFLYTEVLFFGGMFLLYSVFRSRFPLDFHHSAAEENLLLGSINTGVLLTSSFLIASSIAAVKKGSAKLSAWLQIMTIALGAVFLVIKYLEWSEKILHGIYPDSPVLLGMNKGEILFFGLYYVMTGLHGLHVLIGMVVIGVMVSYTLRGVISAKNFVKLENTGLYWHFVDIVWIYLFPLFYLVT